MKGTPAAPADTSAGMKGTGKGGARRGWAVFTASGEDGLYRSRVQNLRLFFSRRPALALMLEDLALAERYAERCAHLTGKRFAAVELARK